MVYTRYIPDIYKVYDMYIPDLYMVYDSQDCLATIPPYPHYIGDRGADYDVASSISDPDSMWIV